MIKDYERQGRFQPKVKTGCKTCKLRRIKCDENRPSCQRCVSSGRSCGGYETAIRIARPELSTAGASTLTWVQPSSLLPFGSDEEQTAVQFFRCTVMDNLPGPFDPRIWHRHVLPVSMTEPSVRHAVIALGSLRESGDETRLKQFALQHYCKAMEALRVRMQGPKHTSADLILILVLLFIAFEFQQNGWDQAASHFRGGVKIITELQEGPKASSLPKQTLDPLVEAFERLDIQMSLFTSTRVHLNRAAENAIMPSLPAQVTFKNIEEASRALTMQMAAMRELVHTIESRRFSPEGLSTNDYSVLQPQLTRQLVSLSRWHQGMERLLPLLRSLKDRKAARLLQVHHISCKLMVSTSLNDGHETLWDSFLADFKLLLETAEDALAPKTSSTQVDEPSAWKFSLDMGVIPPLYFTALKCRDPTLRRRAIALLDQCKHQEGAWTGPQSASLAKRILKLEERGLGEIYHASDVPEHNRLYQAYYDLRVSDGVVYCKRRCLELDGRWIGYEEHVNL